MLTNEEIAARLGWKQDTRWIESSIGERRAAPGWMSPDRKQHATVPDYHHDYNACMGPGGPWRELVRRFESVAILTSQDAKFDVDGGTVSRVLAKRIGHIMPAAFPWQETELLAVIAAFGEVSDD